MGQHTRTRYTSRDAERNHIAQQMNRPMGLGKFDAERQSELDAHTAQVVAEMRAHQSIIAAHLAVTEAVEKVKAAHPDSATLGSLDDMQVLLGGFIARGVS